MSTSGHALSQLGQVASEDQAAIRAQAAGFLAKLAALPRTPLEQVESLEQLRVLEHGYAIAVGIAPETFPGGVDTEANIFENLFMKIFTFLIRPLIWLFYIKVDVSAENMLYALLTGNRGFYQRNTKAKEVGPRGFTRSEEERKVFFEHCLEVTGSVPQ